jgi:hypothetical protein
MLQDTLPTRADSASGRAAGAYKVDISRGQRIGRVSSEWFSRPDDERYLSLSALREAVRARSERATTRTVDTGTLQVQANRDDAERLMLVAPGRSEPIAPTHWSFGQLCGLVGAPSGYLRDLPAPIAAINLQHGLATHRAEQVKLLEAADQRVELRAVTGPDYGRIWDHELVEAVMRIAGDGTGDTRWKVPGLLDWGTMTHNPFVEVTKEPGCLVWVLQGKINRRPNPVTGVFHKAPSGAERGARDAIQHNSQLSLVANAGLRENCLQVDAHGLV